jgi:DNA-binding NarL/FixJ family response regulator
MKYSNILAATKSEAIFPVVNGLAVEADGYMLTHEQMDNVEAALHEVQAQSALHTIAQEQLTAAQQDLITAQAAFTAEQAAHATTTTQLTEAQATIATLTAQVTTLSEQTPPPADTTRQKDASGKNKELPSVKYARERGIPC